MLDWIYNYFRVYFSFDTDEGNFYGIISSNPEAGSYSNDFKATKTISNIGKSHCRLCCHDDSCMKWEGLMTEKYPEELYRGVSSINDITKEGYVMVATHKTVSINKLK